MHQPELGRFLQADPLGLQTEGEKLSAGQKSLFSPGGVAPEAFGGSEMNLFRYCADDPVNRSDPSGLYFDIQGPKGFPEAVMDRFREEGAKNRDVQNAIMEAANSDKPHLIRPAESSGNRNPYGSAGPGHKASRTDAYYGTPFWSRSWFASFMNTTAPHGSITYYDPSNSQRVEGKARSPGYVLVHELGHMIDHDRGTYVEESAFGPTVPVAERRAIWWENQVRPANDQRSYEDWGAVFR
jgi:hypothetical protein